MIARSLACLLLACGALAFPASAQRAPAPPAVVGEVRLAELPPEAREAIVLIRKGGPYPYARDGAVFANREGALPRQKRAYYREYTVKTPGERTRGARRIVAGAAGEFYYTDDHYNHFRRILE
ncbi:MAG: ribonuclease domain-containing protein [Usitatibacter sp.]